MIGRPDKESMERRENEAQEEAAFAEASAETRRRLKGSYMLVETVTAI